jgi:uncharacterized protein YdhG (YjbR/CyaY superfamily)
MRAAVPGAEECISYRIPTFKIDGEAIGGFAAFKDHCSYFPFSGWVVDTLKSELSRYETHRGTIRFATDKPLPATLIKKLIKVRLQLASKKALARTGITRKSARKRK